MSATKPGYFPWTPQTDHRVLTDACAYFHRNGYAVLTSHASPSEISALRAAASTIISKFYDSQPASSIFSSDAQSRIMDDPFFLTSANNISCFLEEHQQPHSRPAINKIGHALHDLDPVFAAFSRSDGVRAVARALRVPDPILIQSMYILKGPRVGGAVNPHRDATFVRGQPSPAGHCLGYWWALEDATLENGCLWAVPGSHLDATPMKRYVLTDEGKRTAFVGDDDVAAYEHRHFVALPVEAGDLIILHGALVHKSMHNSSDKSRHAYSIHVVSGHTQKDCWLQRRADFPAQPL